MQPRAPHTSYRVSHSKPGAWPRAFVASILAIALAIAGGLAHTAAAPRNLLWKASRGSNVVYLVGSLHLLSKDSYPLSPVLDAAFAETDLLVEEVDLAEMTNAESQIRLIARGMLTGGQTLEQVLSPQRFLQVRQLAADLGLPIGGLQQFKPWMIALTLLGLEWRKVGFDPSLGLDKHFYDRARADGKAVQGLETLEFQISRFDEMTWEEQDRMLLATFKELETQKSAVTVLANAWQAGDVETIERIVLQDLVEEPGMYERLLVARNRDWLPKIEALFLRSGRAFVVVGAAHLVGPDGLVAMLLSKGYAVEQL